MKDIRIGQKEIIHFIGIGGIGMSGLAQVMKSMGFKIQGSDKNKNKSTSDCTKSGIKVFIISKFAFDVSKFYRIFKDRRAFILIIYP